MARKFWTLLPETYYTYKQVARGGRNEVFFAAAACLSSYLIVTAVHRKPEPSSEKHLLVDGHKWF